MQQELTIDMDVSPAEVRKFFRRIPVDSLPYFSTEVKVAQIVIDPVPRHLREAMVDKSIVRLVKSTASFETVNDSEQVILRLYRQGEYVSGKAGRRVSLEL